jgi:hypothetical protein
MSPIAEKEDVGREKKILELKVVRVLPHPLMGDLYFF